jgi:hypothetical protein
MFDYLQYIKKEMVRDIVMVRIDELDYVDRQSIIDIVIKTAREQIGDIDEADHVAVNILSNDHNIEL